MTETWTREDELRGQLKYLVDLLRWKSIEKEWKQIDDASIYRTCELVRDEVGYRNDREIVYMSESKETLLARGWTHFRHVLPFNAGQEIK